MCYLLWKTLTTLPRRPETFYVLRLSWLQPLVATSQRQLIAARAKKLW